MSNELKPFQAQEVGITPQQMQRFGITDPEQLVSLAKEVNKYVNTNGLSTDIQGKQYVQVEGWQFAASLLGLIGKPISYDNQSSYEEVEFKWKAKVYGNWVEKKHKTQKYKYFAEAAFYTSDGKEIAKGFAMCSNEEVKKHTFDEYSILSMAQTRAVGKAARMAFAFLIKAAGYQPTPAEEMEDVQEAEEQAAEIKLPQDIENTIYTFTDAPSLAEWANEQTEYHGNLTFVRTVNQQITKLDKENGTQVGSRKKSAPKKTSGNTGKGKS